MLIALRARSYTRAVKEEVQPSPEVAAYDAALRILALRAHSSRQLRTKLERRKFDAETIDATLERLAGEGWLSEARYAAEVVRSRARKLLGPRRIARELESAGVDRDIARDAVRDGLSSEQLAEQLRSACDKKLRAMARKLTGDEEEDEAVRNKVAAYLVKQGYDVSEVIDVVDEALRELKIEN
jgi:regulatory protein